MSHSWMSHAKLMDESCVIYECVMWVKSHRWTRHITRMDVPDWYTQQLVSDMTYSYSWHDSFVCVPWRIYMCDMTHSHVCCESFVGVPWLICMYAINNFYVGHNAFMCAMTHSCVCRDSFIRVPWRSIHMDETTHANVCHDSFMCVTSLIHVCAMTNS